MGDFNGVRRWVFSARPVLNVGGGLLLGLPASARTSSATTALQPVFAGAGGFDGDVQRQGGLLGNAADHAGDLLDISRERLSRSTLPLRRPLRCRNFAHARRRILVPATGCASLSALITRRQRRAARIQLPLPRGCSPSSKRDRNPPKAVQARRRPALPDGAIQLGGDAVSIASANWRELSASIEAMACRPRAYRARSARAVMPCPAAPPRNTWTARHGYDVIGFIHRQIQHLWRSPLRSCQFGWIFAALLSPGSAARHRGVATALSKQWFACAPCSPLSQPGADYSLWRVAKCRIHFSSETAASATPERPKRRGASQSPARPIAPNGRVHRQGRRPGQTPPAPARRRSRGAYAPARRQTGSPNLPAESAILRQNTTHHAAAQANIQPHGPQHQHSRRRRQPGRPKRAIQNMPRREFPVRFWKWQRR